MTIKARSFNILSFLARFIFPTVITMALFLTAFFSIIIPAIEKNSMDRKREMIRELTSSAWTILATFYNDEARGILTREEAQRRAIEQITNLHYGREMKDYFWINDMFPKMVVHPYRTDLNGADLSEYTDPDGKKIFVEMVKIVNQYGDGYVEYMWQWQDEEELIIPKISYIKGFKPWGWIIGTGVYVDDIRREIDSLTNNLLQISLFILLIISMLLAFMAVQSFRAMKQQQAAEEALRESEEKYRTLVESAGEGMLMALEGTFMYANQPVIDLIEYSMDDLRTMEIKDIFEDSEENTNAEYIKALVSGEGVPERFETVIKTKSGTLRDVILSATQISLGGKTGFMAVVTDITNRKQEFSELGESEEKFRTMANNLNVGFFRMTVGRNPRFLEVNPALVHLMGYESREELMSVPVTSLYANPEDYKELAPKAFKQGLRLEFVKFRKKDGTIFNASIWGIRIKGNEGKSGYFDGLIEDMSDLVDRNEKNEVLLSEMQTSLMFFNQQISGIHKINPVTCDASSSIEDAINLMEKDKTDILLVRDSSGKDTGVITDHDLRKALINLKDKRREKIIEIMSSPVISIDDQAYIFEAWLLMIKKGISHLFTTDKTGKITGILGLQDLLAIQNYSPAVLLKKINNASAPDEIIEYNKTQPFIIKSMIESGSKPQNVNHLTTLISDTILARFIEFAVRDIGPPPAKFSFIVFGSEGREEQTLRTDQDNALIFDDVDPDNADGTYKYFLNLGTKVCTWLNEAGYTFCDGNNMAMNPEYCQPISVWKQYFSKWVHNASAEDLLRTKIFFDFRNGYGEESFALSLREHLDSLVDKNPRFFQMLARNILPMAPPIGLFGNFVVESEGEHRGSFDIKSTMIPIVDFARIYALNNKIHATNTLARLQELKNLNILTKQNHLEMEQAYTYLMQIRLRIQARALSHKDPDNYVRPKNLSYIEQKLLKEIFAQTKNFQSRLSYDFTGQLGGL